jgi:hypothetical protein
MSEFNRPPTRAERRAAAREVAKRLLQNPPKQKSFRWDYTLGCIALAMGILIVVVPPQTQLSAALWFFALFAVLVYPVLHLSVWILPPRKRRAITYSVAVLVLVLGVGAFGSSRWPRETIKFKEAPQFTWWRRQIIIHDMVSAKDYLLKLGIPVPEEVPLIGIDTNPKGCPVSIGAGPQVYLETMNMGSDRIRDRSAPTCAYFGYVVGSKLGLRSPNVSAQDFLPSPNLKTQNFLNTMNLQFYLLGDLSFYFNSSFWNVDPDAGPGPGFAWVKIFWGIRSLFGKSFTDQLVAYFFKTVIDDPQQGQSENVDFFYSRRLKTADSIMDNGMSKWPQIVAIINKNGIPTGP